MKLSDLKPCANCGGPLLKPPAGQWYVLRISHAMVNPRAANEVLGLTQFLQGALSLAEVFAPGADDAVWVLADKDPKLMTEVHICFECAAGIKPWRSISELLERANRQIEAEAETAEVGG